MRLSKAMRRSVSIGLAALVLCSTGAVSAEAMTPDQFLQKLIPRTQPKKPRKPSAAQAKPKATVPEAASAAPTMPTPRPRPAEGAAAEIATSPAPLPAARPSDPPTEAPRGRAAVAATAIQAGTLAPSLSADELAFAAPVGPSPLQPEPAPSVDPASSSLGIVLRPHGSLPPPPGIDHLPDETEAEGPATGATDGPPLPRSKPPVVLAAIEPPRADLVPETLSACRSAMTALKIAAKPLPEVHEGECGAPDPFAVSALQDGSVALQPAATINCETASMLSTWIAEDVQAAAIAAYGSRVDALRVLDSYSCRGRNRIVGAQLSEHAFMNAIDVGAFEIGGRWVTVEKGADHTDKDTAFIETIRHEACDRFMTVLGPGSDGYHENHLHLDMRHRGKHGDSRYCH